MPRTLAVMARMRKLVVEEARQRLAACLQAEGKTGEALRAASEALAHEREVASAVEADDQVVEAYIAWLPHGNARHAAARAAAERAEAASTQARAQLSAARASAEAVDRRIAAEAAADREAAQLREQAALDEVALNRHGR
jgi:hypothetical protein